MAGIFFDPDDKTDVGPAAADIGDQALADAFTKQVDAFYALPRHTRIRDRHNVFSPSGVTQCGRQLYYTNTNAKYDEIPLVPWRERSSRNGTGSHDVTQADYLRMEQRLKEAGLPVKFRFLEAEINGERTFNVGDVQVTLRGRSDGKIGLLDDDGNVVKTLIWEKKTKDKRKNLNKLLKAGAPQDEHRAQAVCYGLMFGVTDVMFEYESLQKPEWGDVEPDKPDIKHFHVIVDEAEARALLLRLAGIVKDIEAKRLPPAELGKCGFCPFKTKCAQDGGYRG
jgi:hypothetical protein